MNKAKLVLNILNKNKSHESMLSILRKKYNNFQLLVATMLSSRTKDSTTLPIVKEMFKEIKTPKDVIKTGTEEIESLLYGIGFYKTKAKNLYNLSRTLIEKYNGKVPQSFEDLTSLPGVGTKTANCILSYAFNKPSIAVDVHVHRISNRLGIVKTKDVTRTELELQNIFDKKDWNKVNELLVVHGQTVCLPRKPKCNECVVEKLCDKNGCDNAPT